MTVTAGPVPRPPAPEPPAPGQRPAADPGTTPGAAVPGGPVRPGEGARPSPAGPAGAARRARGRPGWRRWLTRGLSLLVVAGIFGFALPRMASYGSVWASLTAMRWPALLLIALALAGSQVTTWAMITAVLPKLRLRQAATVNLGSSAVANSLPAGGAVAMGVSWAMAASWGVSATEYVRYTVVSGLWNVFARLGLPVVALSLLVAVGRAGTAWQAAAGLGAAVGVLTALAFRAVLRSERIAHLAGRVLARTVATGCRLVRRRPPDRVAEVVADFRGGASELLAARGLRISVTTAASQVTLWLVLLACLRGSGLTQAQVPWEASLAAFAAAQLLSLLPVTPGGLGIVEVGLTAPLVAGLGPAAAARVAAAVLLYRAVTYLLPIPFGAAAYLWWRRSRRSAGRQRAIPGGGVPDRAEAAAASPG